MKTSHKLPLKRRTKIMRSPKGWSQGFTYIFLLLLVRHLLLLAWHLLLLASCYYYIKHLRNQMTGILGYSAIQLIPFQACSIRSPHSGLQRKLQNNYIFSRSSAMACSSSSTWATTTKLLEQILQYFQTCMEGKLANGHIVQ